MLIVVDNNEDKIDKLKLVILTIVLLSDAGSDNM